MKQEYPITLDEIDQWLYDSFGILPGCCSSIESVRHTTARMVAEALWPKKETFAQLWEEVHKLPDIYSFDSTQSATDLIADLVEIIVKEYESKGCNSL